VLKIAHARNRYTDFPTHTPTIDAIVYGIKYNASLTKLHLNDVRMDAAIANTLSRALLKNTTLVELGLDETRFLGAGAGNGSGPSAAQLLSFGLRFNRTLRSLSLDYCKNLTDKDVACLVNAVGNSDDTVLRKLSLQQSPCFDEGMAAVATLLEMNVVEDLDLSYLERRARSKATTKEDEKKKDGSKKDQTEDDKDDDDDKKTTDDEEPKADDDGGDGDSEHKEDTTSSGDENNSENDQKKEEPISTAVEEKNNDGESDSDDDSSDNNTSVHNTSLKRLAMVGNNLDDEYLESLLGVFAPKKRKNKRNSNNNYSNLEELSLFGNRLSNHGVKILLKRLPQFPRLQRIYLGFQQQPPPAAYTLQALKLRTAAFDPGSLRDDFVRAVVDNPRNFRLTDVHIMAETKEDKALDRLLKYHTKLNVGGRRILALPLANTNTTNANANANANATTNTTTTKTVPLGLWPLVLARANRLYPLPSRNTTTSNNNSDDDDDDGFHAGDVIFCLLHGPMVFENLDTSTQAQD